MLKHFTHAVVGQNGTTPFYIFMFNYHALQMRTKKKLFNDTFVRYLIESYLLFAVRFYFFARFSWNTYVVDGHDVEALAKALHDASTVKGKPTAIVAKTFKGRGIPSKGTTDRVHSIKSLA